DGAAEARPGSRGCHRTRSVALNSDTEFCRVIPPPGPARPQAAGSLRPGGYGAGATPRPRLGTLGPRSRAAKPRARISGKTLCPVTRTPRPALSRKTAARRLYGIRPGVEFSEPRAARAAATTRSRTRFRVGPGRPPCENLFHPPKTGDTHEPTQLPGAGVVDRGPGGGFAGRCRAAGDESGRRRKSAGRLDDRRPPRRNPPRLRLRTGRRPRRQGSLPHQGRPPR